MKTIHVFEKHGFIKPVGEFDSNSMSNTFDSYAWKLSTESINSLENGQIIFHSSKSRNSRFGGKIVEIRKREDDGRAIIRFESNPELSDVKPPKGWNRNDWKIVDGQ